MKPIKIIASKIPVVRNVEHWLEKPAPQMVETAPTPVAAPTPVPRPLAVTSYPVSVSASSVQVSNQQKTGVVPTPEAVVALPSPVITPVGTIGVSSVAAQATPTVQKPDVVGQAAGQVAGSVAGDTLRHLLPF